MNEIKMGMESLRMASKSNGHESAPEKQAGTKTSMEACQKFGLETGQRDERNQNGHEILPKSRIRKMSKRGSGQKRAREMKEIETGMKYCRGAKYGECPKSLNISYFFFSFFLSSHL